MPRRRLRTRSRKRKKVRTPGGRLANHYKQEKPSQPKCWRCGKPLHGVPRATPREASKLSSSQKAPNRPYGGALCGKCVKELIEAAAERSWS